MIVFMICMIFIEKKGRVKTRHISGKAKMNRLVSYDKSINALYNIQQGDCTKESRMGGLCTLLLVHTASFAQLTRRLAAGSLPLGQT